MAKKNVAQCSAMLVIVVCCVACFAFCVKGLNKQKNSDSLLENSVEALTNNEESGTWVVCYYESKLVVGYTYYDCGTCEKCYGEKGYKRYSKCKIK